MTNEQLFRAIGEVGDDLIARAQYPKKNVTWIRFAALAACAALVISLAGVSGMFDFGANKLAAPESQFAAADSAAQAPTESAPMTEEAVEEEAIIESTTVEEPAAAPTAYVVFVGNTYLRAADDESLSPKELVGFVEEGHPDYLDCEIYTCALEDHIFVLRDGEYELFRLEQ